MLEIKDLVKNYGQTRVLHGVDLTVQAGEIAVLLGPSGVGKTTLMRCVNLLEKADSGEIRVDGVLQSSVKQPQLWHQKVGMVFQSFNLFPHRTALENISEAPIYAYGKDKATAEAEARDLLELVGLADKADAYPGELSGGQCQRVAIARSCALQPSVLCFDEPTSALDEKSTDKVISVIKTLAKNGMAILIITHDKPFAEAVGNVVYHMDKGKIVD